MARRKALPKGMHYADAGAPPAGAWYVKLLDPFGNEVWQAFPTDSRYFKGSSAGPNWSAL